jgi:hypothetical protein
MIGALLLTVLEHLILRLLLPLQVFLHLLLLLVLSLSLSTTLGVDGVVRSRAGWNAAKAATCEAKNGSKSLHKVPPDCIVAMILP